MKNNSEEFHLIFEDGDPFRAEMVRSALEAADIDCFVQNEGVQNLFSMGSLGGLNPLMGTVKVYIRPEDRERAEKLMEDLQAAPEQGIVPELDAALPSETMPETPKTQGKGFLSQLRGWFLK